MLSSKKSFPVKRWKEDSKLSTSYSTSTNLAQKKLPVSPKSAQLLKEICPLGFQDRALKTGAFQAKILVSTDPVFQQIQEYVLNGQVHDSSKMKLEAVMEIYRPSEAQNFENQGPNFPLMLWHGTLAEKIPSIMQNGLRCSNREGRMLGKGIYFADRASKSAQYCKKITKIPHNRNGFTGYLFLCEVNLGRIYQTFVPNDEAGELPKAFQVDESERMYDSVIGIGARIPSAKTNIDGVIWPLGITVENTQLRSTSYKLLFNEYIIYDAKRVKMKYLVKFMFEE